MLTHFVWFNQSGSDSADIEVTSPQFLANEEENAYVQLEVFGDPAPSLAWYRGNTDLSQAGRFRFWTDGSRGLVFMGVQCCSKAVGCQPPHH